MIPETSKTNKESPTMMAPSFFQEVLSDHSVGWKTKHTLAITLSLKKKKKQMSSSGRWNQLIIGYWKIDKYIGQTS